MKRLVLTISTLAALLAGAEEPYLAENLTVWLRADMGLTTNAVGGVTAWANQGTKGSSVEVEPHSDNSAGHVAYEASGIGGKPSLVFDGEVYLKTSSAVDMGVTSAGGGAWFVVFKTPCTRVERANMGIMGGVPSNGYRFGAFFLNNGTEYYNSFLFGEVGPISVTSNAAQIACATLWKEGGKALGCPMNVWNAGNATTLGFAPASFVFMVGNLIPSWMPTFKGEIAEIRIYNRALTDRERSRIQFELCARYGIHWAAHGDVNNDALQWYEKSSQFGHSISNGVPEGLTSSASSGGATFTLGTPAAVEGARGYFSNSGGNGLSCTWYVSTHTATRSASAATFTFDRTKVSIGPRPALYYRSSMGQLWTKTDATPTETDDGISFTIPAGAWANGFYAAMGDLDSSLAMWHRADMGLSTNENGGVTTWANMGTSGSVLDMSPHIDNSAAHIAYNMDGMGGQPSVSFDGTTYLQAAGNTAMSITTSGAAWFVVCKTDKNKTERGNMTIFGCSPSGNRFGGFFSNAGDETQGNLRGYLFNGGVSDAHVEMNKPQIFAYMHWSANGTNHRYIMNGHGIDGRGGSENSQPTAGNVCIGGNLISWAANLVGDIAEIRVYNRPLTGRERSEIQFELCSRYGVSWAGHGGIADEALAWYANGAQFGYWEDDGLPEAVVTSATAGGATLTLGATPAASDYSRSYMTHNGSNGFDRVWYVAAAYSARALPMTFSVDADRLGSHALALDYSSLSSGPWSHIGTCEKSPGGECAFPFVANAWQSGFYRVRRLKGIALIIR